MPNNSNELSLSAVQRSWYDVACRGINAERLKRLTHALTAIHSPTGAERGACEYLASHLRSIGFEAYYQPVDEGSGNCIARLRGSGGGAALMLYAPIDTHLDADPAIDVPWVGPELRADMLPSAIDDGDLVIGLGASNPKSMLCTLIEAATAVRSSGAQLKGDLIVATCGGGMPWLAPSRHHNGISSGVTFMLSHGVKPDCAVIFKPGDEVYYEHPGMCWFKISVHGTLGYAGLPRGIPGFRSSIVPAAKVTLALEQWLIDYPDRHESAQVRPEGWISALRSGWPDKPAFPSASTEIYRMSAPIRTKTAPPCIRNCAGSSRNWLTMTRRCSWTAKCSRPVRPHAQIRIIGSCNQPGAAGRIGMARPIPGHLSPVGKPMPQPSAGSGFRWLEWAIPSPSICRRSLPKGWAAWGWREFRT